jgi:2-keto-4-pentenoate hydratase/2-oxohepta-3-ene-1,7-dioic acid hydratase in catechol pathway
MMAALNQPLDPNPKASGLRSWHFMKPPGAIVGTGATVRLPARAKRVDYEAELAVVIGRVAKDVPIEHALDYVAGYTAANDLSARDLNNRAGIEPTSPFKFDWVAHKAFDGSCPLGPVMIPAEDIGDAGRLKIQLWVNGDIRQDSCTDQMLFDIADQISDMSGKCTLYPGDIILTGTPAGCGTASGKFLKSGDEIRVKIEGIGELLTKIS